MRPPPRILLEAAVVAVADFGGGDRRLSPPPHSTTATPTSAPPQQPCVTHACRWWPYSGSKEFEANAAMVLIILLSALICALGLNATIRCFLRSNISNQSELDQDNNDQHQPAHRRRVARHGQKNNATASPCWDGGPTLVYSAEMKAKMAGEEAECAICLSEFVDGEGIRLLRRCQHGFHAPCIQIWLSSHSSCPTCRTTCFPPSPPPPPTPAQSAAVDQPSLPESTSV